MITETILRDKARLSPSLTERHYKRIIEATTGSGKHILHWFAISPYFFPANQYNTPDYYETFVRHISQLIPLLIEQRTITIQTFDDFFEPIKEIDTDVHATLVYGSSLYLRHDYLSAIYILTLQLEDLLRLVLLLHNGEVYEQTRNGKEKRPLGRVMRELQQHLPPSVYQYAMWLLKDREGLRLRDTVAHGGFKASNAQPMYAITLIHLLCITTVLIEHEIRKSPRRT
jgi:hypothetical protein